jgi:hypothetical protein
MRLKDITEASNLTIENAISKMIDGYKYGRSFGKDTCYAYAGEKLAELNPSEATIRFWGLKKNNIIVHGDAILADGKVLSDVPTEVYDKRGYELVDIMSFSKFKQLVNN